MIHSFTVYPYYSSFNKARPSPPPLKDKNKKKAVIYLESLFFSFFLSVSTALTNLVSRSQIGAGTSGGNSWQQLIKMLPTGQHFCLPERYLHKSGKKCRKCLRLHMIHSKQRQNDNAIITPAATYIGMYDTISSAAQTLLLLIN